MSSALIVVDVQNDFLPGGALGVTDGDAVIEPVVVFGNSDLVDHVVFTQDYHDFTHVGHHNVAMDPEHQPTFQDGDWPIHCVAGTKGAEIATALTAAFPDAPVFRKGTDRDVEAYSGFDGAHDGRALGDHLDALGVTEVYIAGLALDYCVAHTAWDASEGYHTTLLMDATRPVTYLGGVKTAAEFGHFDSLFILTTVVGMLGG